MTERMTEVVPMLVSGNQATFLAVRLIGEHFKMAKEMLVGFNYK